MRIIARKALKEYAEKQTEAKDPLDVWFHEASKAEWKTPADIKEKYRSASILKNGRVVFNIGNSSVNARL